MELNEITDKAIDYMLGELADNLKLTSWEKNFVESIADQWERKRFLTVDQKTKLGQIWDKI